MDSIMEREPQAVLAFNQFLEASKTIQHELSFQDEEFTRLEYAVYAFMPQYQEYVEREVSKQIAKCLENYLKDEHKVTGLAANAKQPARRGNEEHLTTQLSQEAYMVTENWAYAVNGRLFGARLTDIFELLGTKISELAADLDDAEVPGCDTASRW